MNFKKIFAGALSLAMALSTVNFSYAEPTGEFVDVGGTFAGNTSGWVRDDFVWVEYDENVSHTTDDTGALKVSYYNGWNDSSRQWIKKALTTTDFKPGEIYTIKAYIYGENVDEGDTAVLRVNNAFTTSQTTVNLVQGNWTEVSASFAATEKKDPVIRIQFPKTSTGNIMYVDDVTIEKQSNADEYYSTISSSPMNTYDKTQTIAYGFSALDISETKDVLTVGERSALVAYTQDSNKDTTAAAVEKTRKEADLTKITAVSENGDIAEYNNGEIIAKACGNTVITFTYTDGGTKLTKKLLITVHPNNDNSYIMDRNNASYPIVTDPINKNRTARIGYDKSNMSTSDYYTVNYSAISTDVPTNKPMTASFRYYYTGVTSKLSGKAGVEFSSSPAINAYVGCSQWVAQMIGVEYRNTNTENGGWINANGITSTQEINSDCRSVPLTAGWNNIDIVTDYPNVGSYNHNYMSIRFFVNGVEITGLWQAQSQTVREIRVDPTKKISFSAFKETALIDDVRIVTMDEPFKVLSTSPAVGETLSTLDDIDIKFNTLTTVSDVDNCATLYCGDAAVETVKVMSSDNKKLSVIPQGGLRPNTEYTLKLEADKFTDSLGNTLTGTTEFSFITNNVKISDVVGSGYKLLNSQINMIENGTYTLSNSAEKLSGNVLHLPSQETTSQNSAIKLTADDSFKTEKITPDRVVVEFDARIDSELYENENITAPTNQFEDFAVYAQDKKANAGRITVIGGNRTWSSPFSLWRAYFSLNENNERQTGTTDGTYAVTGTDNPVIIKANNYTIDNIGDVHVKLVYDLNQKDAKGDVKLTAHITGKDLDYTTEQISALFSGYPDVAAISRLDVSAKALSLYYAYNATTKKYDIPVVKSKDTYIKNVNMYALQYDPDSIPDAEIKVTEILNSNLEPIQNAAGLNGQNVYVSATLTSNKLGDNKPYVLVAAAYDKATNKLIDVDIAAPGTISNTETTDVKQFELNLTNFTEGSAEIRVFAWNSLDGAVPLTEVYKPF